MADRQATGRSQLLLSDAYVRSELEFTTHMDKFVARSTARHNRLADEASQARFTSTPA